MSPVARLTQAAQRGLESGANLMPSGTPIAYVTSPSGGGNKDIDVIRDGVKPPVGSDDSLDQYDTYNGIPTRPSDWIGATWATPQLFGRVVFQEGKHFDGGGCFATIKLQVRQGGAWVDVPNVTWSPAYAGCDGVNFETYTATFPGVAGDGIRVWGTMGTDPNGNLTTFLSCGELEVSRHAADDDQHHVVDDDVHVHHHLVDVAPDLVHNQPEHHVLQHDVLQHHDHDEADHHDHSEHDHIHHGADHQHDASDGALVRQPDDRQSAHPQHGRQQASLTVHPRRGRQRRPPGDPPGESRRRLTAHAAGDLRGRRGRPRRAGGRRSRDPGDRTG